MLNTSGRKLFRPLFTLSQLPLVPDPSQNGTQNVPVNRNSIADVETRKHPTAPLAPMPYPVPSIADAPTRKHPTVPLRRITVPLQPPVIPPPYIGNAPPQKRQRPPLSSNKKKLLIVLLIASLIPSIIIIFEIIDGVVLYKQAQDGIGHLQAIPALFHGSSNDGPGKYFNQNKLRQAQTELEMAHANFVSLSNTLDNNSVIGLSSGIAPAQIKTMRALGHIAVDGTDVAQQFIKVAIDIAPTVTLALQQSSTTSNGPLKPFINASSFQEINTMLTTITPLVHNMNINAKELSLNALPISAKERQLVTSILPLLPILDSSLAQKQQWINMVGWFLGIDSPRAFLVEPMDSSELRATGGFTGQFGDLTLNGSHMGQLKLSNIGKYEESHQDSLPDPTVYPKVVGQVAPDPYSGWWPIPNFGLRDANLSADFPTSAKIAMDRYAYEFGKHVDGVIIFTPTLIQQVLHVTGPITIPAYRETITEQNLQARLHYYQLDNRGIRREEIIEKVEDPQVARKLFTQRVTTGLLSSVNHLSINKLLPMANEILQSMKSKDLQIYVTNPQLEALIGKYGSTATLDRATTHDGLFIVQSNLSASKASQYVATSIKDTIALDNQGGATHHLQVTLDYQQKGDVYGLDTYRDYIRIYTPTNSQLIAGNGFDQSGKPYCGDAQSNYTLCQSDVYGDKSLVCSEPITLGPSTSYINDPAAGLADRPLDVTGAPPNLQSDEAGRAMFGGWVVIPKNCIMKVTLSWYVPPPNKHTYDLLFQAQASVYAPLELTIQTAPETCGQKKSLHFAGMMDGKDTSFLLQSQGANCSLLAR
ncbi:MAG: DUF4012 domain-containing protein [Ktedonobacteraceae bacterium]|nr:DUF4012 domain-containing protein [Ktedonobacteraceae bacterium]